MRSGQRERSRVVRKRRRPPRGSRVARSAIMIEIAGDMIGILRLRKLCLVTHVAVRVNELVIAVDMANLTLSCCVPSCKRKVGSVVVKCCPFPSVRRMALGTVAAEVPLNVVRVCCLTVIRFMTVPAG